MTRRQRVRHFTATGFVVHGDSTLLHWHRRVQAWLPPGGHIEPNEDPVQAVLREIREETGFEATIVPSNGIRQAFDSVEQLEPPVTIMVENVHDEKHGQHQHIDLIYFARLAATACEESNPPTPPAGWRWVTATELRTDQTLANDNGDRAAPPEDVRKLGMDAIAAAKGAGK